MERGDILLYRTADGAGGIEVTQVNDTVWLIPERMAELFRRNKSTISRHIKAIFESGELEQLLHFLQQFRMKAAVWSNETLHITISTSSSA